MTCISETLCTNSTVFELIYAATAAVDFAGTVFFGHRWEALAPEVIARAEFVQGFVSDFFARPIGGCQLFASKGTIHG